MKGVSPSLVTLSVTTVVPGWSLRMMAAMRAMKRLPLRGWPCVQELGVFVGFCGVFGGFVELCGCVRVGGLWVEWSGRGLQG
jgi:hypothetical protein